MVAVGQDLRPPVAQLALRGVRRREHPLVAAAFAHDREAGVVGPAVDQLAVPAPASPCPIADRRGPPAVRPPPAPSRAFPAWRRRSSVRPATRTAGCFRCPARPGRRRESPPSASGRSGRRNTSSRRFTMAVTKSCRPSGLRRTIGVNVGYDSRIELGAEPRPGPWTRGGPAAGSGGRPSRAPAATRRARAHGRHRLPRFRPARAVAHPPVSAWANSAAVCQRSAGQLLERARDRGVDARSGIALRCAAGGLGPPR